MKRQFSFSTIIWKEMWQRKSQLVSGLLAITLGIAVIVGIQSVTTVSKKVVAQKLDLLGANIQVLPQGATIDDYYSADIDAPTFPEDYVERVATSMLPGVDNMSPKLSRRINVKGIPIVLTGVLPANELASKPIWQASCLMGAELQLACGPDYSPQSADNNGSQASGREVVDSLSSSDVWVGSIAADRLKLTNGSTVMLEGKQFNVTHILAETGTIDDSRIFAHLHSVQELLGIGSQINAIEIMGCCDAISDGLLSKLRNILPDTRITTINHIVKTQVETNQLMSKISIVLLVIIVLVGAISIGNYMWANVEERKREIGTLITLGLKKIHIYRLFIAKSLVLGLIGGSLGYLFGTLSAMILGPQFAGFAISPVPIYLLWSLIVAVVIAIMGSWYPIYSAARMDPAAIMQEV
jgi:putative ABC transport system permease protein